MIGRKRTIQTASALLAVSLVLAGCGGNSNGNGNADGSAPASASPSQEGAAGQASPSAEEGAGLEPEPGAKLVVWEANEQVEYMKAVAKEFETKYGVPVTVEVVAGGDQGTRLSTDGPSKTAADVLTLPHDQIGLAAKAGLLLPNDVFEEETRATSVEAATNASSYEGVLYGYPKSIETYALFYNKDLFPEPPKTWDEILKFGETYTDAGQKKYAIMWEFVGYYSYPFIGGFGGYMFGADDKDIGLNKGDTAKGFEFLRSLKKILPMNAGDITYDVKTQLFKEGKLALNIDGPWSVAAFKDSVDFGVAPLPKLPNGNDAMSFSGVKSYYVNSYSNYPQAARLFAHFASNKENQLMNYRMTGAIPANKEAGEDPLIANDPITSGFFRQFSHSVPMPSNSGVDLAWEALKATFIALWDDPSLEIQPTLDNMAKTIEDGIASRG
ncbi:maltose ABC transporter substrate-binding protein [Cohnella thailandensis]|uniref:Maltodextrin-binding protein n=1 Tax=Cohnella thailandensis TaxID=557557 RepID=A0A841SQN7_9BACL|nr:maltose ABC transporter substrate-binding protein [Cohnella thailandensis]MBB6634723.1 maltose ABC transporter substrate-binding protein [Cohnella thailandensis]MBP1972721.1 arabinogalactan oligomer/maltooligosaccharide transport system substrate-binding protein [Cohnella thailandensis]